MSSGHERAHDEAMGHPSTMTGRLRGKTITLDTAVPRLEGRRVRVMLEAVDEAQPRLGEEDQARLWQQWLEAGPQGPIEDEGEPEFP